MASLGTALIDNITSQTEAEKKFRYDLTFPIGYRDTIIGDLKIVTVQAALAHSKDMSGQTGFVICNSYTCYSSTFQRYDWPNRIRSVDATDLKPAEDRII